MRRRARETAVLIQSNLTFLTSIDLHLHGQINILCFQMDTQNYILDAKELQKLPTVLYCTYCILNSH